MHPELLNNPTFVRYYEVWQQDPKSLVFAPLADFLCQRKLFADARKICEAGVRHNPNSVLAHYSLAKTYTYTREWHSARHEAQWVLAKIPDHQGAMTVLQQVEQSQSPVRHMVVTPVPIVAAIDAAGGSLATATIPRPSIATGPVTAESPVPRGRGDGSPLLGATRCDVNSSSSETNEELSSRGGTGGLSLSEVGSSGKTTDERTGHPPVTGPRAEKRLPWQTVTMAKIYTQQGHYFKARTIYKTILSRTPDNREALAGLADLELRMAERMSK